MLTVPNRGISLLLVNEHACSIRVPQLLFLTPSCGVRGSPEGFSWKHAGKARLRSCVALCVALYVVDFKAEGSGCFVGDEESDLADVLKC